MESLTETLATSPFHRGERIIQERLGVRDKMERFGRQVIRDFMPAQHQTFYAQLPFILAGHTDAQGWIWASILVGHPGFIQAVSNQRLRINVKPFAGDPLNHAQTVGTSLGLLGIELETRRRNRIAGRICQVSETGLDLSVDQTFGNCPQYIQSREPIWLDPASKQAPATEQLTQLDPLAIDLIRSADTCFVASSMPGHDDLANATRHEGADVSHRGGKPGFIRVDDAQTLTIPDYLGNFHFNTLGNFLENPKAGLLFIDFEHGHVLTLTGTVQILWDSPDTAFFRGAERLWRFRLDHGRWLKNVLPLRWKQPVYSPNTLLTGSWPEAEANRQAEGLRNRWQPYRITSIVPESSTITSFYLQPGTAQRPNFSAGQFFTLKARIEGTEQVRTYTVSSAPGDTDFRISVKHERAHGSTPAGVFSSFLHQRLTVGSVIQAKAPSGSFTFDAAANSSAVLIAAGVGITPMVAMARHTLQEGVRTRSMRPLTLIAAARNQAERAFFDELNDVVAHSAEQIRVIWVLSQPEPELKPGTDYHHKGRLTRQLLQTVLPAGDCDVYLCGPSGFMQDQYDTLRTLGVPDARIFAEAFGPAALTRDPAASVAADEVSWPVAKAAVVTFTESQLEQAWSPDDGNLLTFAEAHGLTPAYGCRNGQCGRCKVRLLKGKVCYQHDINAPATRDDVLLCSAFPATDPADDITRLVIQL